MAFVDIPCPPTVQKGKKEEGCPGFGLGVHPTPDQIRPLGIFWNIFENLVSDGVQKPARCPISQLDNLNWTFYPCHRLGMVSWGVPPPPQDPPFGKPARMPTPVAGGGAAQEPHQAQGANPAVQAAARRGRAPSGPLAAALRNCAHATPKAVKPCANLGSVACRRVAQVPRGPRREDRLCEFWLRLVLDFCLEFRVRRRFGARAA